MTTTDTIAAELDAAVLRAALDRRERIVAALDAEGLLDRITGRMLDYLLTCSAEDLAVPSARRMAERTTVTIDRA